MAGIMNDELMNLRQRHGLSPSINDIPNAELNYSDNPPEMSEFYPNTPPTTINAQEQDPQSDQQMLIIEDMPAPPRFEDVRKFTSHQMLQLFNAKYSVVVNTADRYKHKVLGNDGLQPKFSEFAEKNKIGQRREYNELFVKARTLFFEKDAVIREDATFFIWSKGFIDILLKLNDELLKDINQSKKERDMTIVEYGRYIQNAKMLVRFIKNDNVPDLLKVKTTDAQGKPVPFIDVYSDVIANIITQLADFSKLITRMQMLEEQNKKLIEELNKAQAEQTAKDNKINDLNNICSQIETNIGDKVDQLCLLSKLERTKKATEIIVVSDKKEEMSPTKLGAADSSAASSSNSPDTDNSFPSLRAQPRTDHLGARAGVIVPKDNVELNKPPITSDSSSINSQRAPEIEEGAPAQGPIASPPARAPYIQQPSAAPALAIVPPVQVPPHNPTISKTTMEIGNQKMNISDDLKKLFQKPEDRQKEIRANAPNIIAKLAGSRKAIYDFVAKYPDCTKRDIQLTPDVDRYMVADDLKFLEDNGVLVRDMAEKAHRWRLA